MGRESMLKYGEIQLLNSGESVKELMNHLDAIIKKHGVPNKGGMMPDVDLDELHKKVNVEQELIEEEDDEDEDEESGEEKLPFPFESKK